MDVIVNKKKDQFLEVLYEAKRSFTDSLQT